MFSDMISAWRNFHVHLPRYGWNSRGEVLDIDAHGNLVPWQVAVKSQYFYSGCENTQVFENQNVLHFKGGTPVNRYQRTGMIGMMQVVRATTSHTLHLSVSHEDSDLKMDSDVLLGLILQESSDDAKKVVEVDVSIWGQFFCTLHLSVGVPTPILFGTHPIMIRALQYHSVQLKCSVQADVKTIEAYLPMEEGRFVMRSQWLYDFGEKASIQISGMMSEISKNNTAYRDSDSKQKVPVISDVYLPWLTGVARSRRHIDSFSQELFSKAWHPNRMVEWCWDEEDKKELHDHLSLEI
jgi:hypothetical protein